MDPYGAYSRSTTRGSLGFLHSDTKMDCLRHVARIMAQLFELTYGSIENLFHAKDLPVKSKPTILDIAAKSDTLVLDRMVTMEFC